MLLVNDTSGITVQTLSSAHTENNMNNLIRIPQVVVAWFFNIIAITLVTVGMFLRVVAEWIYGTTKVDHSDMTFQEGEMTEDDIKRILETSSADLDKDRKVH